MTGMSSTVLLREAGARAREGLAGAGGGGGFLTVDRGISVGRPFLMMTTPGVLVSFLELIFGGACPEVNIIKLFHCN
jgi:hypothetical protein